MIFRRQLKYLTRRFMRMVLQRNDSPRQIAGGVAIGTFVSFNPTVISQMGLALIIATLFRCSRIPAMGMVYLSNPLTALPMYGTAYLVGVQVLAPFGFKTPGFNQVMQLFTRGTETGFWSILREKSLQLAAVGWQGLVPMEIGATVVGLVAAVPAYWVTLRLVTGHRLLKAERMALRAQRRLERIRWRQEQDHELERMKQGPIPPPPQPPSETAHES